MFEVIPVVGCNRDGHYFRKWLEKINSGEASDINKKYIERCARLEQLEESIRNGIKQINGKFVFIGEILRVVEDERLYTTVYSGVADKNCADIYRYAYVKFGVRKTTTFNLISIAKTFAVHGELVRKYKEFSYSQLAEMLSMTEEEREKVNPDMTVKQIRELKNALMLQAKENVQTSESIEYGISDEIVADNDDKENNLNEIFNMLIRLSDKFVNSKSVDVVKESFNELIKCAEKLYEIKLHELTSTADEKAE